MTGEGIDEHDPYTFLDEEGSVLDVTATTNGDSLE
jgi:hypothetical protein